MILADMSKAVQIELAGHEKPRIGPQEYTRTRRAIWRMLRIYFECYGGRESVLLCPIGVRTRKMKPK